MTPPESPDDPNDALLWSLADELRADHPELVEGTIMNGRCLRLGSEFLALVDRRSAGLVVKLPRERVAELIAADRGRPFAPAGRVFREWVLLPRTGAGDDARRWRGWLEEAIAFVG